MIQSQMKLEIRPNVGVIPLQVKDIIDIDEGCSHDR